MSKVEIYPFGKENCIIKAELNGDNFNHMNSFPGFSKWKDGTRDRIFRPTANNIKHIRECWPEAEWLDGTFRHVEQFIIDQGNAAKNLLAKETHIEDDGSYQYKTKPFDHQRKVFLLSRELPSYALFMEQGTGKTKPLIDTAAFQYAAGLIDTLIVIAPNGVHGNWIENEIPIHLPDWCPHVSWIYSAKKMNKKAMAEFERVIATKDKLRIFAFNVEGFTSDKAKKLIERIINTSKCNVTVDESQYIKNPSALRTKYLTKVCEPVAFKRIATGTPVTKGVEDTYSQFKFMNEGIIGFDSFYTFRNHFCTMGGYEMKKIVGYKNINQLTAMIDPYSFRVTKAECLDLPPKLYKRWLVELTPQQRKIYDELKNNYIAELEGHGVVGSQWAMVRELRLQQIMCGWFPNGAEDMARIPGDNPKLEAVRQHCLDTDGPVVVWTRFKEDVLDITEELRRDHGRGVVASCSGATPPEERVRLVSELQAGNMKALVCTAGAMGRGHTMTRCENPIIHSNTADLEHRLQLEDRHHRIGTTGSVTYTDVEAKKTCDRKTISALIKKKNFADMITRDPKVLFMEDDNED